MRRCFHNGGFAFLLILAAAVPGCGPSTSVVEGVLKVDGSVYSGATITFIPAAAEGGQMGTAVSKLDGSFTLTSPTNDKQGVPSGLYKVVVTKTEAVNVTGSEPTGKGGPPADYIKAMKGGGGTAAKNQLPAKYSKADSTPLTVKIPLETTPYVIEVSTK